ncbi:unnamed protein product, partial [marine sediment metagenome]
DILKKDGWTTRAKSYETFCPLGPVIATGLDTSNLSIKAMVNNKVVQDGNTGRMIFSVKKIISYISEFMLLQPGDVIITGTPLGGAFTANAGDTVEIQIEGIGVLKNRVVGCKYLYRKYIKGGQENGF